MCWCVLTRRFSPVAIKQFAERFSRTAFEERWKAFVSEQYADRR